MSRAEPRTIPHAPRLGRVLRTAAEDLYYHGVRLVPTNVAWGLIVLGTIAVLGAPVVFVALIALVPLTAGVMGMATTLVRQRTLVMSDFIGSLRPRFWAIVGIGVAQLALIAVAVVDLLIGLQVAGVMGLVLTVTSAYTAIAIWLLAVAIWPLLLDPVRADLGVRQCLRLGALLVIAHPVRIGLLALVVGAVFAVSTVLLAAILTFALVFGFLVCAHYVLPAADRLEGRATVEPVGD